MTCITLIPSLYKPAPAGGELRWRDSLVLYGEDSCPGQGRSGRDLPSSPNPDFVDNIFENRGVLWVARLSLVSAAGVLAFGGIFIVLSIGMRMRNGEWLRRAGPFEISEEELGEATSEAKFWRKTALASQEEVVNLRESLRRSRVLIGELEKLR